MEAGDQLQFSSHGSEETAQSGDVHIAPRLELRDGVLPDLESLGDGGLGLAYCLSKVLKRHLLGDQFAGARLDFFTLLLRQRSDKVIQRSCHSYLHLTSSSCVTATVQGAHRIDCRLAR